MRLSSLHVYPIKSCGGISVDAWDVKERGLLHDRRWMLVDETGLFMSQRKFPRMALIGIRAELDRLVVDAPGMPSLEVPFAPPGSRPVLTSVWGDLVESAPVGEEADRWFGEFLDTRCRLVHMPEESVRPVDQAYGSSGDYVGFADGFSFLLISEASLSDLNRRLHQPLPMNRFRPNVVIEGCEPFAEDGWGEIRIGAIPFRVIKPCARCAITTVDQKTGQKAKEPLRTLATFRKKGSKVLFGQNLAHDETGTLRTGDSLEVVRYS